MVDSLRLAWLLACLSQWSRSLIMIIVTGRPVRRGSLTPPTVGPEVSRRCPPLETYGRPGGKVRRPCHNFVSGRMRNSRDNASMAH